MSSGRPIVYVLDDDSRIREALSALLSSAGHDVITFGNAAEYLAFQRPDAPACLILDLDLPGMTGLELQTKLADVGGPPIIFLTGHGDIPSTVKAMKAGATEFLSKPFEPEELLRAIDAAIHLDGELRLKNAELSAIQKRYSLLTPREREVLPYVVSGLLNKETAWELGTSEITIRIHRGQIMKKMAAQSLADLVRMAGKIGIPKS
ncbi:MAG TPA: response regulator [Edaphobacter sp.]|jgi:FixJ family two-component response regulator|nr:response regulator [Edaphobacter sp.]